jgi:hypothetical protein
MNVKQRGIAIVSIDHFKFFIARFSDKVKKDMVMVVTVLFVLLSLVKK